MSDHPPVSGHSTASDNAPPFGRDVPDTDVTAHLRIRQAVRAILLTPRREVLLARFQFTERPVWALPGGGIDPGETPYEALRRELLEELGHEVTSIGPHVWDRLHIIPFLDGRWDGQREQVHLVDVAERFDPQPHFSWDQLNAEYLHEFRWWTLDDIAAATDVHFVPAALAQHLADLLAHGPPQLPIDVGV